MLLTETKRVVILSTSYWNYGFNEKKKMFFFKKFNLFKVRKRSQFSLGKSLYYQFLSFCRDNFRITDTTYLIQLIMMTGIFCVS